MYICWTRYTIVIRLTFMYFASLHVNNKFFQSSLSTVETTFWPCVDRSIAAVYLSASAFTTTGVCDSCDSRKDLHHVRSPVSGRGLMVYGRWWIYEGHSPWQLLRAQALTSKCELCLKPTFLSICQSDSAVQAVTYCYLCKTYFSTSMSSQLLAVDGNSGISESVDLSVVKWMFGMERIEREK